MSRLALLRPAAGRLFVALVAGVAAAACAVGLTATSAWLISRAAVHPPVLHLMVAIVAVRAFGIGRGVLRYVERVTGHDGALRVLGELRVRVFRRLERLAPAGLAGFRRGDLAARLVDDVESIVDLVVRVALPIAVAAVTGLASVLLVWSLLPAAGLALAAGVLVVGVGVPLLQAALVRRADARLAPLRGTLAAGTVDLVQGLPDLIAAGAVGDALAALDRTDRELLTAARRSSAATGVSAAVTALCTGLAVLAALIAGALAVRGGTLHGELLAVVVLTPLAVFEIVGAVPPAAQHLAAARTALRRLAEVAAAPDPAPDPLTPVALRPAAVAAAATPVAAAARVAASDGVVPTAVGPDVDGPNGVVPDIDELDADGLDAELDADVLGADVRDVDVPVVRVEGVAAQWVPGRPVVRDVSFVLEPGARVALTGPSGSGKSTIASLLVRWLDPCAGRITLGGVDLRDARGDDVRRIVGYLGDDAYLFDSTIEANLRIGKPDATEAELASVLRRARLTEWVRGLPDGLATGVGEHGVAVSGGQRRRIALARALLADFPVLVLDEPTEHLDEENAVALLRDLMAATRGRTVLLITHRTDAPDYVDSVITLHPNAASPNAASLAAASTDRRPAAPASGGSCGAVVASAGEGARGAVVASAGGDSRGAVLASAGGGSCGAVVASAGRDSRGAVVASAGRDSRGAVAASAGGGSPGAPVDSDGGDGDGVDALAGAAAVS
ncbi:amino acid ABC transporter ATP-binding/permease protein [Dactylosporangium sp. CA-052675]|uniref:amino acid ABC transporter ATP-binding/permease protein n=1 Tax=Dactylosporangium sp. CA-052675 TaxID=3239927 RepID=UPI003D8D6B4F